jgi:hypothetical protein
MMRIPDLLLLFCISLYPLQAFAVMLLLPEVVISLVAPSVFRDLLFGEKKRAWN